MEYAERFVGNISQMTLRRPLVWPYHSQTRKLWEADGDGANARRLADSELPSLFTDPGVSPHGDFIAAVHWQGSNDGANSGAWI